MTKKIIYSAPESIFDKSNFKNTLMRFLISPPLSLREKTIYLSELLRFFERNILLEDREVCCLQCFKAHAISKAREYGFSEKMIAEIDRFINCETGHNGYYLDNEDLIKII